MNKKLFYAAWASYLVGIIIVLVEIFLHPDSPDWGQLGLGSVFFMFTWITCIVHSIRSKSVSAFWVFFLFVMGSVAVPIFLIRYGKED